jgi:CBS domain-containing protein
MTDQTKRPHDEDEEHWLENGSPKRVFDEHVLDLPIKKVETRSAVIVEEGTLLADAIRKMRKGRIGSAMITRGGKLVGIFTERDLMNRVALGEMAPASVKVEELMQSNPVFLTPEHPLAYALNVMSDGGFRHLPLVDKKGRPVGIISVRDIVDYLAEFFHEKVLNLPPTPGAAIAPKREGG